MRKPLHTMHNTEHDPICISRDLLHRLSVNSLMYAFDMSVNHTGKEKLSELMKDDGEEGWILLGLDKKEDTT